MHYLAGCINRQKGAPPHEREVGRRSERKTKEQTNYNSRSQPPSFVSQDFRIKNQESLHRRGINQSIAHTRQFTSRSFAMNARSTSPASLTHSLSALHPHFLSL